MSQVIRIYRKGEVGKVTKADADAIRRTTAIACRVQRPALLEFFLSGEFGKLSVVPAQVIDNRAARILEHHTCGWTVPGDSLGRKGQVDASQAQSILLWIKKNVPAIDAASVSVVVEPEHDGKGRKRCTTCGKP
jgi:hypothetical protein